MIAACPRCSARYRIEAERLGSDGVRLRCSRCESVFRVRPPVVPAVSQLEPDRKQPADRVSQSEPAPPVASSPTPAVRNHLADSRAPARRDETSADSGIGDRTRLVLIADPEVEAGRATAHAVADWGLTPVLVHDGVEAIMSIQRMLPRVVVMDAALPKMFGFQVCEVLKRNESLRDIHVVLVGAIHNRARYRRPPIELYGADSYVERHELLKQLRGILSGIGMPTSEVSRGAPAPVPEPRPVAAAEPAAAPQPVAAPPVAPPLVAQGFQPAAHPIAPELPQPLAAPPASPSPSTSEPMQEVDRSSRSEVPPTMRDPRIADAERLARIVVSDIILYNQQKFDIGVRDGNVLELMASDLAEGRSLFDSRVEQSVRGQRDFLAERLVEVARERGMS